ncbi:glycosyltransferase [Pantoea coffeiphila]|uniref:glycosyltransferase n=1 Tax=Pantoea coffeiphila TaxID=1465635 RepID=UPI001EF76B54|nr:glycosyltransferase [Pantoea coffeiphila]MBM7343814.1 glycosyltransferase involved in cell wall biosynthesis [Pantoea coffeiphila]
MKKKIALIIPFLGRSGAERVIFNLLNNLDRNKFELHLLLYKDIPENNSLLNSLSSDVIVNYLNIKGRVRTSLFSFVFKLRRYFKDEKIDSFLISDGVSNAALSPFLFLLGKNVKKIARESNLPTFFEKNILIKSLYKYCYRNYDVIVVQSNEMYEDLSEKFNIPKNRITKINNPLDISKIRSLSEQSIEYVFKDGTINLLTIGRLTYQKGFDLLINALANFSENKYHLTIIGDGEENDSLRKLAEDRGLLNCISFIKSTDNPYAFMKKADIFISSSRWEGYPNVVIEAIACGTPVVSNNYPGGISEIINERNGVICNIENHELEKSIETALMLTNVGFDEEINNNIMKKYENIFY